MYLPAQKLKEVTIPLTSTAYSKSFGKFKELTTLGSNWLGYNGYDDDDNVKPFYSHFVPLRYNDYNNKSMNKYVSDMCQTMVH